MSRQDLNLSILLPLPEQLALQVCPAGLAGSVLCVIRLVPSNPNSVTFWVCLLVFAEPQFPAL